MALRILGDYSEDLQLSMPGVLGSTILGYTAFLEGNGKSAVMAGKNRSMPW
jgi:hypothetical protein